MAKYDALRERALANFDNLLSLWQINYIKVNDDEYDFLNPTRQDENFGACRFNIAKGTGADFAGTDFTSSDFKRVGAGFDKSDFAGFTKSGGNNWGFDIIGLKQRLSGLNSYQDAARDLIKDLTTCREAGEYRKADPNAKQKRDSKRVEDKKKILTSATKTWNLCKPFENTLADNYLRSRRIYIKDEPNIRFHHKIYNKELNTNIPAVLFKVSIAPDSDLIAIHRIYIAKDGSRKARIENPKKALGTIQGAGIWFGTPGDILAVVEGPENALSVRCLGYNFVVCTISATNFSNLAIPNYVKTLILMPDPDEAGKVNSIKAVKAYARKDLDIKISFPPRRVKPDGKLCDWNELLMGLGNGEGSGTITSK